MTGKLVHLIAGVLVLCLCSASVWADSSQGPEGVLTLETALEFALMYSPELASRALGIQGAEAHAAQEGLWSNPELEIEVEEFGGSGDLAGFDAAEIVIRLEHELELSGARSKRKQVASIEKDLAVWDYETMRLDLITWVTQRFLETLTAQARLSLADEILGLGEITFATVQERVDAGKDPPVEKSKAHVALSTARISRIRAERALETARQRLAESWGGLTPRFEKVAGKLDVVAGPPPFDKVTALLEQNPDLARWTSETAHREAKVDLESRNGIPTPSIFGGYKHFQADDGYAYLFGVSIPLPLFNRNQGAVREAKYNLAQAGVERRAAGANIRAELTAAYHELSEAYSIVGILNGEILPSAQDAFDVALRGYRNGKFQYLIVLDAQRTLFESRGSYIDALEAYHSSRTALERLIGAELSSIPGAAGH